MFTVRHLFDYESAAGQAFIKDSRLKSFHWTKTGIKLTIPEINKEMDLGKYQCDVDYGPEYDKVSIEVKEIFGQSFIGLDKFQNCQSVITFVSVWMDVMNAT